MKKLEYKNFSEAVVDIGRESGDLDEMISGLKNIEETLSKNLEFRNFLCGLRINFSVKEESLRKVFKDSIGEKVYNFIFLLIKKEALVYLEDILVEINNIKNKKEGVVEVEAVSSRPISDDAEQKIRHILGKKTNKKIIVNKLIDKSVIGGLVVKIGDVVIDGSIKGKISRLKNKIVKII